MSLLLHIIVTYIEENIITKLQKFYSPPRNPSAIARTICEKTSWAIYRPHAKYSLKGLVCISSIHSIQLDEQYEIASADELETEKLSRIMNQWQPTQTVKIKYGQENLINHRVKVKRGTNLNDFGCFTILCLFKGIVKW